MTYFGVKKSEGRLSTFTFLTSKWASKVDPSLGPLLGTTPSRGSLDGRRPGMWQGTVSLHLWCGPDVALVTAAASGCVPGRGGKDGKGDVLVWKHLG